MQVHILLTLLSMAVVILGKVKWANKLKWKIDQKKGIFSKRFITLINFFQRWDSLGNIKTFICLRRNISSWLKIIPLVDCTNVRKIKVYLWNYLGIYTIFFLIVNHHFMFSSLILSFCWSSNSLCFLCYCFWFSTYLLKCALNSLQIILNLLRYHLFCLLYHMYFC